jgi:hypothetical protein
LPTLATLASASEFNLRAAANTLLGTKSSDPAEARVMVHGLLHDTSAEDLNIISKSVVSAYNSAYSTTGYSFAALKTMASVSIPDKVCIWPGCRWCPNDDALADANTQSQAQLVFVEVTPDGPTGINAAMQSTQMQDSQLSVIHKKFGEDFCGLLRASGSANLAKANECSLSMQLFTVSYKLGFNTTTTTENNKNETAKDAAALSKDAILDPFNFSGLLDGTIPLPTPGAHAGTEVAIIGAGCAGMAATNLLMRLGLKLVIYELSDRIGGRTYSHPMHDQNEVVGCAELGAMRIPTSHTLVFDLCRKWGIKWRPFPNPLTVNTAVNVYGHQLLYDAVTKTWSGNAQLVAEIQCVQTQYHSLVAPIIAQCNATEGHSGLRRIGNSSFLNLLC